MKVTVNELEHRYFLKDLLTTTFWGRFVPPVTSYNFFWCTFLTLHCSSLHKRSLCAKFDSIFHCIVVEGVSRVALQYLLLCLFGRFIDFQRSRFYGSLGHSSGFLRLFFHLLPASFIISRAVHAHFSENAQFCFLSTGLTSFPCTWILFNDGCHLYAIRPIKSQDGSDEKWRRTITGRVSFRLDSVLMLIL